MFSWLSRTCFVRGWLIQYMVLQAEVLFGDYGRLFGYRGEGMYFWFSNEVKITSVLRSHGYSVNSTDKNNGRHVPGKIVLKYSKPRVITYKMLCISRSVNDCSVMCACILNKIWIAKFQYPTKAQTQKKNFKACSEHLWSWVPKAWPFCQCEEEIMYQPGSGYLLS